MEQWIERWTLGDSCVNVHKTRTKLVARQLVNKVRFLVSVSFRLVLRRPKYPGKVDLFLCFRIDTFINLPIDWRFINDRPMLEAFFLMDFNLIFIAKIRYIDSCSCSTIA